MGETCGARVDSGYTRLVLAEPGSTFGFEDIFPPSRKSLSQWITRLTMEIHGTG